MSEQSTPQTGVCKHCAATIALAKYEPWQQVQWRSEVHYAGGQVGHNVWCDMERNTQKHEPVGKFLEEE